MTYKFTSFATPDPNLASIFLVKYLGARALGSDEFVARYDGSYERGAMIRGVRFDYEGGTMHHDVYFVHDPNATRGDMMPTDTFNDNLNRLHRFGTTEAHKHNTTQPNPTLHNTTQHTTQQNARCPGDVGLVPRLAPGVSCRRR